MKGITGTFVFLKEWRAQPGCALRMKKGVQDLRSLLGLKEEKE
jgi:hypothetical protein